MQIVIRVATRQKAILGNDLLVRQQRFFEGLQANILILRIDILNKPLPGANIRDFSYCFAPFSFLSLFSPVGGKGKDVGNKGLVQGKKGKERLKRCLRGVADGCRRGRGRVRPGCGYE